MAIGELPILLPFPCGRHGEYWAALEDDLVPVAMFASDRFLGPVAHFTARLQDAVGAPVPNAPVSIALIGEGSLEANGEHEGLPFLFQETDEDGLIYFSWRCSGEPANLILNASSQRGASLLIRQL